MDPTKLQEIVNAAVAGPPVTGASVARVIREAPETRDPARQNSGMAPNYGGFVLPQVATVQGLAASVSRTYRIDDEALRQSYLNARYMKNDVGILECIGVRKRSVSLLDWHLEPENEHSQDEKELCGELTKILERIPRFMQYRECLAEAIWAGRAATQHQFQWRPIGRSMRVQCVRWLPINGDKLVWKIDEDPLGIEQIGIRVGPNMNPHGRLQWDSRKIQPTERGMAYFLSEWERQLLTIHKHQIEDGSYETPWEAGKIHGVGLRSQIFWEWFQKQELMGFLMEYLERSAFGFEMWYYPFGNENAREATEEAIKNRIGNGRNCVMVPRMPGEDAHLYSMERIEPGLAGVDSMKAILEEYFGHRIKRLILGQTLTSEADATGLGSGLAEVHLGTFLDIVRYDAINLQETLTDQLVRNLQIWNFPASAHVRVKLVIDTESKDAAEKLKNYQAAWQMNARVKEADVLAAIGASLPTPEDMVLQGPNGGVPGQPPAGPMGQPGIPGMPPGQPGAPGDPAAQDPGQAGQPGQAAPQDPAEFAAQYQQQLLGVAA